MAPTVTEFVCLPWLIWVKEEEDDTFAVLDGSGTKSPWAPWFNEERLICRERFGRVVYRVMEPEAGMVTVKLAYQQNCHITEGDMDRLTEFIGAEIMGYDPNVDTEVCITDSERFSSTDDYAGDDENEEGDECSEDYDSS